MAPDTVVLCRRLRSEASTLAAERLADEWEKVLVKGSAPSRALDVLAATEWLDVFPEIDALRGIEQDPTVHPEGDVFTHTRHVLDSFARRRTGDRVEDLVVGYACLCHDFGKSSTMIRRADGWRAPGHGEAGVAPTESFLRRLAVGPKMIRAVTTLVRHHGRPAALYRGDRSDAAVRRLSRDAGGVERIVRLAHADQDGRPPLRCERFEGGEWLLARAQALGARTRAPEPILAGRHLIDELAWDPGPEFGAVLDAVYEAQLDGSVTDLPDALALARQLRAG